MPDSEPTSTIGVQRGAWADLPPEIAVLLAPPVTVTAGLRDRASTTSPGPTPVGGPGGHSG
ncbi:hypothetical protein [Actinoplanes sp. NPDC023714]|uniref:hypothetical protein n=1 Tax=Actinoplanes sp. NPDC023714 TaxID=3154322 RepID=UPI0033F0A7B3